MTARPTAIFVSPHLDDVAFSCGGTLICLAERGWRVVLATAFTRSVPQPTGFALACQTDKGIDPAADYMALRRTEDVCFGERAGVDELVWLDLPEAPHRGYDAAPELFGAVDPDDGVHEELGEALAELLADESPALLVLPQAAGHHVDHQQTVRAALRALPSAPEAVSVLWYRDTPYVIREPAAAPSPSLERSLREVGVPLPDPVFQRKLHASAAYTSQLRFQFGGEAALREKLTRLAAREAVRTGAGARRGEAVLASPGRVPDVLRAACPPA